MRRTLRHICLLLFTLCSLAAYGQMRDSLLTHYLGVEGHIGYDNLFTRSSGLRDIGGAGGGVGVLYKFQYRPWRFQTGVSLTSLNSLSRGEWSLATPVAAPYPTMTLYENYRDVRYNRHALSLSLPVKAGYRWGDWTFMAGLRAGLPVWQTADYSGHRETTLMDEQLYDPFADMPNHGLTSVPFSETRTNTMGFDLSVEAEVIWDLDKYLAYHPKKKARGRNRRKTFRELLHYEVSLFASAGVLNSGTPEEPLNSFFVGGRFAVFYEFEHPKPKKKGKSSSTSKPKSKPKPKPKPATTPKTAPDTPPVVQDTIYYGEQVITKGEAVVLHNLYFAVDKTDVLPSSREAMDALYTFLAENPEVRIRIVGHTDNTASEAYNLRLSKGRADAVAREMIKRGIDASRLETDGKGMAEPVADNSTEEGRQQNRRVEFIVL
ncbi:MAG: OmpA family protein [Paludibacteraceae bacterium]|nr:OmpA family protein [Paludibacteraceae bacterium]